MREFNLKEALDIVRLSSDARAKEEVAAILKAFEDQREELAELRDPGFNLFVATAETFLTHYPPEVFDGSSGDAGVLFVVALREAMKALKEKP